MRMNLSLISLMSLLLFSFNSYGVDKNYSKIDSIYKTVSKKKTRLQKYKSFKLAVKRMAKRNPKVSSTAYFKAWRTLVNFGREFKLSDCKNLDSKLKLKYHPHRGIASVPEYTYPVFAISENICSVK